MFGVCLLLLIQLASSYITIVISANFKSHILGNFCCSFKKMKLFLKLHWTLLLLSNYLPSFIHKRRQWQPTPLLLPAKSHGWRSLVGCSPWGREELDRTERLRFHFSLSCLGKGNGNPLQCSCLENLRDSGARWAAICGVAQSQTRLKWLSSSSSKKTPISLSVSNFLFLHGIIFWGIFGDPFSQ